MSPVMSKYTAHQKVEHAELALEQQDLDKARECLQDAASLAPEDAAVLDAYGAFLAEHGPQDTAVSVLQKAVALAPDEGHEKYMYLGQLLEGEESIGRFQRGVEVLRAQLGPQEDLDEEQRDALACALCSLAEAHLGCSDPAEVGTQIEALLQEAIRLGDNPEPLQAMASLRVEQGRPEEALTFLRRSMAMWYHPPDGSRPSPSALQFGEEEDEEPPSYEFRLETVKLLLELDDTVDTAAELLQDLVEEDDRVLDAWYLLAMCLLAGGEPADARVAVERGQALAKSLGMPADDPMWQAFDDTKADIIKALDASGET